MTLLHKDKLDVVYGLTSDIYIYDGIICGQVYIHQLLVIVDVQMEKGYNKSTQY